MTFNDLLAYKNFTVYSLSKKSGIPRTTIFDIASSKTNLLECTGKTLKALSIALDVSINELLDLEQDNFDNLPSYLEDSITRVRNAIKTSSPVKNIYLNQLYICADNAVKENRITEEQAKILKERYNL